MSGTDESKTINIVFGAPISTVGSTLDEVIGKLNREHPNWVITSEVVIHSEDGISILGRTPASYQNLNNVKYRDGSYSTTSKHGTSNVTGRDAVSGKVLYQGQAEWIKNFLK